MIITHVLVYYFPFENERPKSFTVKHSDAAFEAMYDCNSHSWQILRSNMRSLCWWLFIMSKGFNSIAYTLVKGKNYWRFLHLKTLLSKPEDGHLVPFLVSPISA